MNLGIFLQKLEHELTMEAGVFTDLFILKDRIEKTLNMQQELEQEQTYHVGQRFGFRSHSGDYKEYILAMCSLDSVILINLKSGNLWSRAVKCKNGMQITKKEFSDIIGPLNCVASFRLIKGE